MNEIVKNLYISIVSSILGGAAVTFLIHYLGKDVEPVEKKDIHILKFYKNNTNKQAILSTFLLLILVFGFNFFSSGFAGFIANIFSSSSKNNSEIYYSIFYTAFGGSLWSIVVFTIWGTLGTLIYMIGSRKKDFNFAIFISSGFLAGIIVLPIGTLSFWLISDNLFELYTMKDVYNFHPIALIRLYLPVFIYPIGYGILTSYYFLNINPQNQVLVLYNLRFKSFFIMLLIIFTALVIIYSYNPTNFVWQTLIYYNVLQIWLPYIIIFGTSFLIGTLVFEKYLQDKFFISSSN